MVKEEKFRVDYSSYNFHNNRRYAFKEAPGISEKVVRDISKIKNEPEWMLDTRLKALHIFQSMPLPKWGADISALNFSELIYYARPTEKKVNSWDEVPDYIKETFERLGIPEAERKFLSGVSAQYESETVYHKAKEELDKLGIIFTDIDSALTEYPELFKKYFGRAIPMTDNKFSALNTAFWSGGSFIYVPKGVNVPFPLQAYFRLNIARIGQFERTIIIADKGSSLHYIEGCSAPIYNRASLHSGVVEVFVLDDAKVRYTTIQNWSKNVYNLVTQRAIVHKNARMEWVDGNIGSKTTMKYPSIVLLGEGASGEVLSISLAGRGQCQDAGAKAIHLAPNTSSRIISKSVSLDGGRSTYRGLVRVSERARNAVSAANCDALILDEDSSSDTIPYIESQREDSLVSHEASVGKISDEQLFYLKSRGLSEEKATDIIVSGFLSPFTKELPLEYAIELNRLIRLEMKGAVG